MCEKYQKSELLLGKSSTEVLKNSAVLVVGIGGVGSYAVEVLARAGVGKIGLADNDKYAVSNINRQLYATDKTLGKYKTDCAESRIKSINESCETVNHKLFVTPENIGDLKLNEYDYIIDAVDNVNAKIALICEAKRIGVPIISSMGAGNKLDPTAFRVADIFDTSVCPLARILRKKLKSLGITDVKVVYSRETPVETENNVTASVPFVPSVCGIIAAGEVIKDLIGL